MYIFILLIKQYILGYASIRYMKFMHDLTVYINYVHIAWYKSKS